MNKLERILDKIEKENKKKEDSTEKIKELKLQAKELAKEFERLGLMCYNIFTINRGLGVNVYPLA